MATDGWRSSRTLKQQLRDSSGTFDYFQWVQLLDRESGQSDTPESTDDYRFSADLDCAFPASEIRSLKPAQRRAGGLRKRKESIAKTSNYCVAGYSGPLPEPYTDWIREQQRYDNHATADFLDIFNHRINRLRYEAKTAVNPALDQQGPCANLLANGMSAAMGMLGDDLYQQVPLSRRSLMALAGLLSNHRTSAHLIERVLRACFKLPIEIRDLVGAWQDIADDQLCRLGRRASHLGELSILGQQIWDMRARVRANIGEIPFVTLLELLADADFVYPERRRQDSESSDIDEEPEDAWPRALRIPERVDPDDPNIRYEHELQDLRSNALLSMDKLLESGFCGPLPVRHIERWVRNLRSRLYGPFVALVRFLTNRGVDVEVKLEVIPETVPALVLARPGQPEDARFRLGQTTWLGQPTGDDCFTSYLIAGLEGTSRAAG